MVTFQRRSIGMCIVLYFVTCGIYGIYWYYTLASDMYNCNTPNRVDMSPIAIILLNIVTFGIYGIYVYYKWGKQMPEIFAMYGRMVEDRSMLYLLLAIFVGVGPVINLALMQNDVNNLMDGTSPPLYGQQPPYYEQGGEAPPPPPPPPGSPYDGQQ